MVKFIDEGEEGRCEGGKAVSRAQCPGGFFRGGPVLCPMVGSLENGVGDFRSTQDNGCRNALEVLAEQEGKCPQEAEDVEWVNEGQTQWAAWRLTERGHGREGGNGVWHSG
jgi:hypothetical protein